MMMVNDVATRDLNQHGFIGRLPLDILPTIFSYLNQHECLTCMAVCRAWLTIVPEYAKSVWSTLRLYPRDLQLRNQYRKLCLGSHVKRVYLTKFRSDQDLYRMVQKIIQWGCTHIESLSKQTQHLLKSTRSANAIFSDFDFCATHDQLLLLALLRQLPNLTQLNMFNHCSNVAFIHILNECPKLTRFVYQVADIVDLPMTIYGQEPLSTVDISKSVDAFPNLTYLCLDAVLGLTRTYPILKRCPNLRYFMATSNDVCCMADFDIMYKTIAVPLDVLFDFCPKLVHVDTVCSYAQLYEPSIETDATSLRHFSVDEGYGYNQIASHLQRNQQLKFLRLCKLNDDSNFYEIDWSSMFRTLCFSQLQSFIAESVGFDAGSLVILLNQCHSLETLALHRILLTLSLTDVHAIHQRPTVLSLKCQSLSFSDEEAASALLDKFPSLKTLTISDSPGLVINVSDILHNHPNLKSLKLSKVQRNGVLSTGGDFTQSKLERIELCKFGGISYDLLLSLTRISTLRRIHVYFEKQLTDDQEGLLRFVKALTSIEILEFDGVRYLSYDVLESLGGLPRLKIFREESWINVAVDRAGLLQMLHKSTSLVSVFFHQVIMVDQHGQDILGEDETIALVRGTPGYAFHAQILPSQRLLGSNQGLFHNAVITNKSR